MRKKLHTEHEKVQERVLIWNLINLQSEKTRKKILRLQFAVLPDYLVYAITLENSSQWASAALSKFQIENKLSHSTLHAHKHMLNVEWCNMRRARGGGMRWIEEFTWAREFIFISMIWRTVANSRGNFRTFRLVCSRCIACCCSLILTMNFRFISLSRSRYTKYVKHTVSKQASCDITISGYFHLPPLASAVVWISNISRVVFIELHSEIINVRERERDDDICAMRFNPRTFAAVLRVALAALWITIDWS